MNSSPKQYPLRWRTTATIRKRHGIPNSTSSRSPGSTKIPAYKPIPPSLSSVPRPETATVETPFATATRTGRSTGCRCHRRVLGKGGILADDDRMHSSTQITKVQQVLLLCWVVIRSYSDHRLAPFSRASWLSGRHQSQLGAGSRHCYGIISRIEGPKRPIASHAASSHTKSSGNRL
jgi:hypothetical protein